MRERRPSKTGEKWGTGDLGDNDAELFKHLPDPQDLLKGKTRQIKKPNGRLGMKILALIGSPRKGGNTDILVDQILKGAKTKGHTSEKLYLYKYKILPCTDCRKCKKGEHVCPVKDDMRKIYPKIAGADVIIFGTPNYWNGPTGQMKLLFDRMRPFAASEGVKGKKGIVVSPAGAGPKACGPLVEMFRMSFDHLKMKFVGRILATAYEKGEIAKDKKALKRAYDLGASLK